MLRYVRVYNSKYKIMWTIDDIVLGRECDWPREEVPPPPQRGTICTCGTRTLNADMLALPFAPNAINVAIAGGKAVLSYPFSGCWMTAFEYREAGCLFNLGQGPDARRNCPYFGRTGSQGPYCGDRCPYRNTLLVAHVSTGGGQDCYPEWNRIAGYCQVIRAFKPHAPLFARRRTANIYYGVVADAHNAYAISAAYSPRHDNPVFSDKITISE